MQARRSNRLSWGIGALGVLTGGLLLGALLGAAADPEMKDPPAPWWQATGREENVASAEPVLFDPPEGLNAFGGYRPDLDYEAEVWSSPIPESEWAAFDYEPYPADEEFGPVPYDLPSVTSDPGAADDVADDAELAVEEAKAAEQAKAEPESEIRKSPLARAGLY